MAGKRRAPKTAQQAKSAQQAGRKRRSKAGGGRAPRVTPVAPK